MSFYDKLKFDANGLIPAIIQEVITLSVFVAFAMLYLGEKIRWNHLAAFVCILAAVAFTFMPKN